MFGPSTAAVTAAAVTAAARRRTAPGRMGSAGSAGSRCKKWRNPIPFIDGLPIKNGDFPELC